LKVWMNGRTLDASSAYVSVSDRGFTLGDGLFETMLWTGSDIRFFDDHMDRLSNSAIALSLSLPETKQTIAAGLFELSVPMKGKIAAIRLTLSRGQANRGLIIPAQTTPLLVATISAFEVPISPVKLMTVTICRNSGAPSSRLKTLSYIDNIMALDEARAAGFDDAIMLGTAGNLACASSANIIIQYKGANLTPALEDGALAGIVRGKLLASGQVQEARVSVDMLANCQSSALTNALIGVRPVGAINGRDLENSRDWLSPLQQALWVA
jgi:branched-chain amino acid aminotransferase